MSNGTGYEVSLPSRWVAARIGDVAWVNPRLEKNGLPDDLVVSFVPMKSVEEESGRMDVSCTRPLAEVRKGYTPFRAGDVIMAKITPCMENGKIAVVPDVAGGLGFGSTEFHVLRPYDGVSPYWLFFYLLQRSYRRDARLRMTGSAGQLRVPAEFLAKSELPVAPTAEQNRIVAEIEKQFSRLDAGVAALRRVAANLKRYKAAVLKAACTGALTADWRAAHPDVEPAAKLLDRILKERRRRWEAAELAKLTARGKSPKDDKWKGKYKEPFAPDPASLPTLPPAWTWVTIEQLAADVPRSIQSGPFGSNLHHSEFGDHGILAIGIDNVQDCKFSLGSNHRVSEQKYRQLAKYQARPGDVLVTVMATVGRCCVVPENTETAIITKHVYRISPDRGLVFPAYMMWMLAAAPDVRLQMKSQVRGQTRPGLNGQILRQLAIPLPPLDEQGEILSIVDRASSVVEAQETEVLHAVRRSNRLRQAALKDAFEGKLVEQDPTDEPASVLLDRIRAEREKRAGGGKPKRSKGGRRKSVVT